MSKNKSPIIEIHGTGIHNRGAELMAIAVSEKLREAYPNVKIVVPSTFGQQEDIKKNNFYTSFSFESRRGKHIYSLLMGVISGNTINPSKVDVVLDASGFAFSDQWGNKPAERLWRKMITCNRRNQLLILLPQALGSFSKNDVNKSFRKLFERAKIVFARDEQSYKFCHQLFNETLKLKKSPDFTLGVKPLKKDSINLPSDFVAIVPNYRMLDKSNSSNDYLEFIRSAIDVIRAKKLNPVFVIHDGAEDFNVISQLGGDYQDIETFQDSDPRVLKWILGKALFVIGSRFHALVSTMSQGVPCIGAGWSHKYPELFADFSNKEGLIADLKNLDELERQISNLADPIKRSELSNVIKTAAQLLKDQNALMWDLVLLEINKVLKDK